MSINSAGITTASEIEYALSFPDGVNAYAETPSIDVNGPQFAVAFRFQFSGRDDYARLFQAGGSVTTDFDTGWNLEWKASANNTLRIQVRNNGSQTREATSAVPAPETWYRAIAQSDGSTASIRLYDDDGTGSLFASASCADNRGETTTAPLYWMVGDSRYTAGDISQAAAFDRPLTSAERDAFATSLTVPSDALAAYPLDDGEGTTLTDTSGNATDATAYNTAWREIAPPPGTGGGGGSVDTTPPSAPSKPEQQGYTSSSVTIGWQPVNASDLDYYTVYLYDSAVETVPAGTTTAEITGLTREQNYEVSVTATDTAGNESTASPVAIVTPHDTNPPEPVTNLRVTERTDTSLSIAWTQSTSDDVSGYRITVDGTQTNSVDMYTDSWDFDGLDPETTYTLGVIAEDTTNRTSDPVTVTATTESIDTTATWLSFDGSDDYVETPPFDVNGPAFAVALRVRFPSLPSYEYILSAGDGVGPDSQPTDGWSLQTNDAQQLGPAGRENGNGFAKFPSSGSYPVGEWTRLIVQGDASAGEIAVYGYDSSGTRVYDYEPNVSRAQTASAPMIWMAGNYRNISGDISRVVGFDRALTSAERDAFGADGSLPAGAVADYPITAGSGTTLTETVNGNDATIEGGANWN